MSKQTAVEWIEDELSKLNSAIVAAEITQEEYHKQRVGLWEKSKQMEKEQIIDACIDAWGSDKEPEEYYNEMYKKQS